MVARDIDLTILCPVLDATRMFEAIRPLAAHPRVLELRFRNDTGHWNVDPGRSRRLVLVQHKPLLRPGVLEGIERDRQVDDPGRAARPDNIQGRRPRGRPSCPPAAFNPHEIADRVITRAAQTEFPRGFPNGPPRRGHRDVVPVERDHESVNPGVARREPNCTSRACPPRRSVSSRFRNAMQKERLC